MRRSRGRRSMGYGALLLVALALGSCGNVPKLTLNQLPVPPELVRYEGAAETPLDGMWSAMLLARADLPTERAVEYYWMPPSITWAAVNAFYQQRLGPEWRMDTEHGLPNGERWTRTSTAGEQVLVVSEIGINQEQGSILMLSLVTE